MRKLLMLLVHGYQRLFSPFTVPRCRFQPTCSHYALDALEKHGALKGTGLTVKRLLKCHPLHGGGWDPVPDPITGKKTPLYDPDETPDGNADALHEPGANPRHADKETRND